MILGCVHRLQVNCTFDNLGWVTVDYYIKLLCPSLGFNVSRHGLVVRRSAGKWKTQVRLPAWAHLSLYDIVIYGHCLVTLPCIINETLKWLTSLPILMWKSFWW